MNILFFTYQNISSSENIIFRLISENITKSRYYFFKYNEVFLLKNLEIIEKDTNVFSKLFNIEYDDISIHLRTKSLLKNLNIFEIDHSVYDLVDFNDIYNSIELYKVKLYDLDQFVKIFTYSVNSSNDYLNKDVIRCILEEIENYTQLCSNIRNIYFYTNNIENCQIIILNSF